MADLQTFRAIQKDAEDKRYPRDNTKARPTHANYAEDILDRVKAERGIIRAALQAKQADEWIETSQFARDHPFEQVLTAFPEVERFIARQEQRRRAGQLVTLIDGKRRHVLSQACAALYTHMKSFFKSGVEITPVDADSFAEDLTQVVPDATAIVEFFS